MSSKNVKALGLCSGGLDSILAGKLLEKQGIDVTWITFETPFFSAAKSVKASKMYGIPLIKKDITETYLKMLKNPPLGYGKHMNPCRDCHSLMFQLAGSVMEKEGYDFIFSGEVAGQRPLSQTKQALRYVEKSSGFDGHILRPLSAQCLPETSMETRGLVDRDKLLNISGRSRTPQVKLAKEYGVTDYPSPAGGCLLTDKNFSNRLRDLFDHEENTPKSDLHLLKFGRHIRLNDTTKIIVGRTRNDNANILKYFDKKRYLMLDAKGIGSPTVIAPADADKESIKTAAAICISYTKTPENQEATVIIKKQNGNDTINVTALNSDSVKEMII